MNFSVLMSVYYKENPEWLSLALKSIWDDQTKKPNEIVLVKDGKLTNELEDVILKFSKDRPVKIVALEQNVGLGRALNEGLKFCSNELVARMDSDDISVSDRFEKQLIAFNKFDPDVMSGRIDEFENDPSKILLSRILPESESEILKLAKTRNPMNHVAAMFKKSSVLKAGGYKHFLGFEDYYLWCRMIKCGCKLYNTKDTLVYVRFSPDVITERRSGFRYAFNELHFLNELRKLKILMGYEFLFWAPLKFFIRLLPKFILNFLYSNYLHKKY